MNISLRKVARIRTCTDREQLISCGASNLALRENLGRENSEAVVFEFSSIFRQKKNWYGGRTWISMFEEVCVVIKSYEYKYTELSVFGTDLKLWKKLLLFENWCLAHALWSIKSNSHYTTVAVQLLNYIIIQNVFISWVSFDLLLREFVGKRIEW